MSNALIQNQNARGTTVESRINNANQLCSYIVAYRPVLESIHCLIKYPYCQIAIF